VGSQVETVAAVVVVGCVTLKLRFPPLPAAVVAVVINAVVTVAVV
jgi:hypothetical protein